MTEPETDQEFRAVAEFCENYPDAVSEAERQVLQQQFVEFASDHPLSDDDDPDTLRAVASDIEYVGERLGVDTGELTQGFYERADEIESEREEQEPSDDDGRPWRSARRSHWPSCGCWDNITRCCTVAGPQKSWPACCSRLTQQAKNRRTKASGGGSESTAPACPRACLTARRADSIMRRQIGPSPRSPVIPVKAPQSASDSDSAEFSQQDAVAASILTNAYFILRDGVAYRDLGPDYLDRRDPGKVARRLAKRIEALGYSVELRPAA